ncbi:NBS-LRR type resistance protein [Cucumis melo var. makuwa]|uniref:NBS-LRR type resistance protein n=1 Tax=Cucumis melo var. makuwa TaxID=1194695 RepID=A0A5A7UHU0_CUCMM|nr:NBS-LRR type resistance protein [Cucumis melo var. makuwa]
MYYCRSRLGLAEVEELQWQRLGFVRRHTGRRMTRCGGWSSKLRWLSLDDKRWVVVDRSCGRQRLQRTVEAAVVEAAVVEARLAEVACSCEMRKKKKKKMREASCGCPTYKPNPSQANERVEFHVQDLDSVPKGTTYLLTLKRVGVNFVLHPIFLAIHPILPLKKEAYWVSVVEFSSYSSGSVERTYQSRDPEGYTYQSSDPEGCTYQSSALEGCTYQSSAPEGCTYQSSAPEGCTYQSGALEGCTYP